MAWLIIFNRKSAGDAPVLVMQFTLALVAAPLLLIAASVLASVGGPGFAVPFPSADVIAKCALVAVTASTGHLLIYWATTHAGAALVSPMTYVQLIVAAGLGWAWFGDVPDALSVAGRSADHRRRAAAVAEPEATVAGGGHAGLIRAMRAGRADHALCLDCAASLSSVGWAQAPKRAGGGSRLAERSLDQRDAAGLDEEVWTARGGVMLGLNRSGKERAGERLRIYADRADAEGESASGHRPTATPRCRSGWYRAGRARRCSRM
jgi:hypothetical protein